jgi:chemotaxis protein MotB
VSNGTPTRRRESDSEAEDWLVTYADAITLLMAFFVMLLTFAEFDIPAYEELKEALAKNVGKREDVVSPTQLLKIDVQDAVFRMGADDTVTVSQDEKGVVIELASNGFYKPGSADFRDEATPVLAKIAEMLGSPKYDTYLIEVSGHTDDVPISTEKFPSNWELSAARASRVVRFFGEEGLDVRKMKAAGFADTRPKVPNLDPEGAPIPENRATNRRTVLHVTPMTLDEKRAYLGQLAREEDLKRRKEAAAGAAQPGAGTAPSGSTSPAAEAAQPEPALPAEPANPAEPAPLTIQQQ